MNYGDLIQTILALCAVLCTIGITIAFFKLASALDRVERLVERAEGLAPEVETLLSEARHNLSAVEHMTSQLGGIAEDAGVVSSVARDEFVPLIRAAGASGSAAMSGLTRANALYAAIKVGLKVLAFGKSNNSNEQTTGGSTL